MSHAWDDELVELVGLFTTDESTVDTAPHWNNPAASQATIRDDVLPFVNATADSDASKTTNDVGELSRTTSTTTRSGDAAVSRTKASNPPREHEQHRRRRNREAVARHRRRQHERLDTLHDQETTLQHIFRRVLSYNKHITNGATSTTPWQRYQAQFTELVRLREALLLEKHDLVSRLAVHEQRARALQSISEQVFSKSMLVCPRAPGGAWLQYEEDEAPFYYEPVSEEVCRKTIAIGLNKLATLLRTLPERSVMAMPDLLGWTTERAFTYNERGDPVILFRFSRRVPQAIGMIDEMLERSWKIITTPDLMSRTTASAVHTQLVQQVHDDIVILVRNAPEKKSARRSRYLQLYHKTQTDNDPDADPRLGRSAMIFTMLMSRGPHENCNEMHHHGQWLKDGCSLMRYSERPATPSNREPGLDFEYMGYLECRNQQHGEHIWTEVSLLLLRWERVVLSEQPLLR